MAEANMMGLAGGLLAPATSCSSIPSGCSAPGDPMTRSPWRSPTRPNVKSRASCQGLDPGGPSHQAIDDVALMRALPNMTVIDVADAIEVRQVVEAIVDVPGPVYVRLKRGEIPVLFDDDHVLSLTLRTSFSQAPTSRWWRVA